MEVLARNASNARARVVLRHDAAPLARRTISAGFCTIHIHEGASTTERTAGHLPQVLVQAWATRDTGSCLTHALVSSGLAVGAVDRAQRRSILTSSTQSTRLRSSQWRKQAHTALCTVGTLSVVMVLASVAVLAMNLIRHLCKLAWSTDMTRDNAFFTLIAPKLTARTIRAFLLVVVSTNLTQRAVPLLNDM